MKGLTHLNGRIKELQMTNLGMTAQRRHSTEWN